MAISRPYELAPADQGVFLIASQFVANRLQEWPVVDWALELKAHQHAERAALREAYERSRAQDLPEPWLSFWGWLFESWTNEPPQRHEANPYMIGELIGRGDRSRTAITGIVDSVRPFPEVSKRSRWPGMAARPKKPKAVSDMAFIHLSSGKVVEPNVLKLERTDARFLTELANTLEASVRYGMDVAARLSGNPEQGLWRLGELHRVYPVQRRDEDGHKEDPDDFNSGIAPATKLLYTVVEILAAKDKAGARQFIERWGREQSLVFVRLWAALARDADLAPIDTVAAFLKTASARQFWDVHVYPEIAELRARRFRALPKPVQVALANRIMKLPPRSQWPKQLEPARVESGRRYFAVRELRRIEIGGGDLPPKASAWLRTEIEQVPELQSMSDIDEGFDWGPEVRSSGTSADLGYDALAGDARLQALETALGGPHTFDKDPAGEARYWLATPGRILSLISDLEAAPDAGARYTKVWDVIGWARPQDEKQAGSSNKDLGGRMLGLIARLPDAVRQEAVVGLTDWLSAWEDIVNDHKQLIPVWFALWPHAVQSTNEREVDPLTLDAAIGKKSEKRYDIDTLNNPTGKMVGVFLHLLPPRAEQPAPFAADDRLQRMRDMIVAAPAQSGLIGKYRFLQALWYFLSVDPGWAREHLVGAVKQAGPEAPILWRALSWRTQFESVVRELGAEMAHTAVDDRFDRETRKAMGFSLTAHMLNSFWDDKAPELQPSLVTQMLRACDDEVRAHCANALKTFVDQVSARPEGETRLERAARIFRKAVSHVLTQVWPQERSLSTPGVARALADLPASTGEAFAEAVTAIERYMVPFDAWSMLEFGLYGSEDAEPRLERIDDANKAEAFLQLLDLSVGRNEGAVVPHDLAAALRRIVEIAPELAGDQRHRRLATLSRR